MKNILTLIAIATLTSSCSWAQPELFPTKPWIATLKIVDESDKPVAGANAEAGYIIMPPPGAQNWGKFGKQGGKIEGLTDTNGLFTATHTDRSPSLGFQVQKAGYYKIFSGYEMGFPEQNGNRNISMTLTLRKIGDPIAMYAKRQEMKLQKEDEPMGFDLMAGDWVTPLGKGFHTDMFFTAHRKIISERKYDGALTVTFPNKGDGLVVAPPEAADGSEFKTSRTAAESGYQPELDLHYSNTNQPQSVFGYFIRVRTELNQDGKIQSAYYGKVPGNFMFFAGTKAPKAGMAFTYYLNPTANERNVEFDPKRNLIRDLNPLEEVKEP